MATKSGVQTMSVEQDLDATIERWWRRLSEQEKRNHVRWVAEQTEMQLERKRAKDLTPKEYQWHSK